MKTVYYASNMQSDLFPYNSRSKFESYIHHQHLNYIPSGDIEVGIKSITFDYDLRVKTSKTLALKSNLSYPTISSYGWDDIVCIFTIHKKGVQQFEFENPTFFPTDQHRLSRAEFRIVDIESNTPPDFSIGSPTFIEVVVKNQLKRMKTPFQLLLDSSCEESLKRFPTNTNTEFCIQLPKRMEFQKDWMVCLKSIHFSNKFYTLQDCAIKITGVERNGNKWGKIMQVLREKFPHDLSALILMMNTSTAGFLKFSLTRTGKVKIKIHPLYLPEVLGESFDVEFTHDMAQILGLHSSQTKLIVSHQSPSVISKYKGNISALDPLHFIVCCNLVEESILGGQRVKVLKYFPRQHSVTNAVDQSFAHNNYVKLNEKNFDRITIRIADLTGKTIQCDPSIPTRLQLLFVNTNSI